MYNETCPPNSAQHVVTQGDTFWKLSRSYGIDVDRIIEANPGVNANNLQIGSVLCIPGIPKNSISPPSGHTCPDGTFLYLVHSGDTLWKLSQAHGVSVQDILDVNPGVDPQNLQIGSTLCIPAAQAVPAPSAKTAPPTKTVPPVQTAPLTSEMPPVTCPKTAFRHTIQSGDTFWKLSQAYGVNLQDIVDANPGVDPQNLQIGSTVCIPNVLTAPAPSAKMALPSKTAPLIQAAPLTSEPMPVTCPKGALRYTIQSGDTFWKLSQAYGVNLQDIVDANPGVNPQNLQIGSTVCIPNVLTAPAPSAKMAPPSKTVPLIQTAPVAPKATPVTCPKGALRYTIQSGDTLWKLSQAHSISVQDILDINPGVDPQNLQIGSTLCIPAAQAMPAPIVKETPPAKKAPLIQAVPPTPVAPSPPKVPITAAAPSRHFAYCVKRCDTISGIARKFYVSPESILRENPGINPQCLQVGTYICVPFNCCGENTWRYTVREDDTLNRIANKLNVCPSAIVAANPNIDFQHLVHCQVICIPKE